jgi:hypothetical protein
MPSLSSFCGTEFREQTSGEPGKSPAKSAVPGNEPWCAGHYENPQCMAVDGFEFDSGVVASEPVATHF